MPLLHIIKILMDIFIKVQFLLHALFQVIKKRFITLRKKVLIMLQNQKEDLIIDLLVE